MGGRPSHEIRGTSLWRRRNDQRHRNLQGREHARGHGLWLLRVDSRHALPSHPGDRVSPERHGQARRAEGLMRMTVREWAARKREFYLGKRERTKKLETRIRYGIR